MIEDRLHYVRDETLGEDRRQTHTAAAPQALAALRNGILTVLRYHGWSNIAEANRRYDACPQEALHLLGGPSLETTLEPEGIRYLEASPPIIKASLR